MTKNPVKHFLITYDIEAGTATVDPYGINYEAALKAYSELEEKTGKNTNLDIVLVGAEDLDIIKRTHSSYFETVDSFESLLPEGIFSK